VQINFSTGTAIYDNYYGGSWFPITVVSNKITKINDKKYLLYFDPRIDGLSDLMNIEENPQTASHVNFFVEYYSNQFGDITASNNFKKPLKDVRVYFYNDGPFEGYRLPPKPEPEPEPEPQPGEDGGGIKIDRI
jgi:hypothetical protein